MQEAIDKAVKKAKHPPFVIVDDVGHAVKDGAMNSSVSSLVQHLDRHCRGKVLRAVVLSSDYAGIEALHGCACCLSILKPFDYPLL